MRCVSCSFITYLTALGLSCSTQDFCCVSQTLQLQRVGLSRSAACGILVPWSGIKPTCLARQGGFLTAKPPACVYAKSRQSCPPLFDLMDCSLPGSSVRGILQARILEWFAVPVSKGSSPSMDRAHVSYVCCIGRQVLYHWLHLAGPSKPPGKPPDYFLCMTATRENLSVVINENRNKSYALGTDFLHVSISYHDDRGFKMVPTVGFLNKNERPAVMLK